MLRLALNERRAVWVSLSRTARLAVLTRDAVDALQAISRAASADGIVFTAFGLRSCAGVAGGS